MKLHLLIDYRIINQQHHVFKINSYFIVIDHLEYLNEMPIKTTFRIAIFKSAQIMT